MSKAPDDAAGSGRQDHNESGERFIRNQQNYLMDFARPTEEMTPEKKAFHERLRKRRQQRVDSGG